MEVLYQLSYSPEEHPKLSARLSDATDASRRRAWRLGSRA